MPQTPRIGIQIGPDDPFWVQVREVMWRHAQALSIDLVEIAIQGSHRLRLDEQIEAVENLVVQELDALISNAYPPAMLVRILEHHIPIVFISEVTLRHPLLAIRTGLYDAGMMLGAFLSQRLPGPAHVIMLGGLMHGVKGEDRGESRIAGFTSALPADGRFTIHHVPSDWLYAGGYAAADAWLAAYPDTPIDAIFGLSDQLALAARDACRARGRLAPGTLVLGVNGDPLALAAITEGSMAATVETDVDDIASQAIKLAYRMALGEAVPETFQNLQRLVTTDNVAEVAVRKLLSLADLPTRLVGVYQRSEQQRVTQLETSLAIDQQIGHILDEQQLSLAITGLIRDNYSFDAAQFLIWDSERRRLVGASHMRRGASGSSLWPDPAGPLAYALAQNQAVFIPNTSTSHRFAADPLWPEMHARVVVPVRLGGQIIGLLDLHRRQATHLTREEIDGLQLLADQLGIAVRNAELYSHELDARALAEKADRLKTSLLANVSHELRTPLNVILGYSRAAIDSLAGGAAPPADLGRDLGQIYHSGEHLMRLINDLLDLSRAEIGELDLIPERINTAAFLSEVFRSCVHSFGGSAAVSWRLDVSAELPMLQADPVRLRQILLNLLHNAAKFTEHGQITLGARPEGPTLHLWVADTGVGIPQDLHEQIFDPFVSEGSGPRRREGIGLGLSITRRLVILHRGQITLESAPGKGSSFHIHMPLSTAPLAEQQPTVLLISATPTPPASVANLAERRGLAVRVLHPLADLSMNVGGYTPSLLVWDLASAADSRQLFDAIRAAPRMAQVPVMLYRGASADAATELLLKPLGDEALIGALSDIDPRAEGGILIVEDDPGTRALHRRLIAERFPSRLISEAGDGRAALEAIDARMPSLIVLDLILPDLDGFAVLEALRASLRGAAVPVLVLSGKILSADDIRRLGEARVIFQTKELLSPDELADTIRRVMSRADLLPPQTSALVKAAIAHIQQHHAEPLTRQEIADAVGVSKDYLGRIFQQELGLSPWDYLIRYRVLRAKELLRGTSHSIAEVAARVGFDTASYFSTIFHREVGCSPREYRAAGRFSTSSGRDP